MQRLPTDVAAYEQHIKDNAAMWTTFYRQGPHRRMRTEHSTERAALDKAAQEATATGRAVMVYAVTAEGRDTLAHVVRP